jgi:type II secretory pathway pseudopilin PulG
MTLVEILIAVLIVGFSCLAIFTVHVSSLKTKNVSDNMTLATTIAVSEFERLKTLPFEELLESTNTEVSNLNRLGQQCTGKKDCSEHIFTRRVRFFPKTPTSLSCQVEIEVDWRDSVGRHSQFFSSVISTMSFT